MTVPMKRRFDAARLFRPESVSLSGTSTPLGQRILANLRAGGFAGQIGTDAEPVEHADVALVADEPGDIQAALLRHARMGARGAVVLSHKVTGLDEMARQAGIRVMGPHSFGLILPGLGLNASPFALMPQPGRMALVGQSSSIARTVIDWAAPNAVGFSHLVGIGGNTDIGFGLVLDQLSRDPNTAAIMVEIDRLRDPQLFFSAARAAARLRPVVAIVPGMEINFPGQKLPAMLEAAMARAGVLLTSSISEFLAAAETLTRVKPARGESLAIITNSTAIGRLSADEAVRSGVKLAELSPETRQVLSLTIDKVPASGPIFVGKGSTRLADTAALLSSAPEVGGILVVHAPSDGEGDVAIEALIACAKTVKIPLLITVMGEALGLRHRHILSQARLACFDTPESAVAGFRHLLRNRRNRAAARELPDSAVLSITPDKAAVAAQISAARARGQEVLLQDEALALVSAYNVKTIASRHVTTPDEAAAAAAALGFPSVLKLSHPDVPTHLLAGSVVLDLPDAAAVRDAGRAILVRLAQRGDDASKAGFVVQTQAPRGTMLRVRVSDHPVLGPLIGFGAGGGDPDDVSTLTADLPPLNLPLAHALIHRAQVAPMLAAHRGQAAADEDAIAAILVRISQLILDTPEIALLDLDPVFVNEQGAVAASARIVLRPPGETRPAPIISPYPADLITTYEAKGMKLIIRPIRPEDADAHIALISRVTPEDMRYRFFSPMRSLPVEQITRMTDVDYRREMAFIAKNEVTGATMGVARLVRDDTDGITGEFAVAVESAAKGLGLGSALMRAIIDWGRAHGVKEIIGQVLADNAPMLAFVKHLGFTIARIPEEPDLVEAKLVV
ncbi:MAG: GNAT family N-acetyltransferase [Acidocella sp.]